MDDCDDTDFRTHPFQKHVNAVVCLTVLPILENFNKKGVFPQPGIPSRVDSKFWKLKQIKYRSTVLGEPRELNFKTLILNTYP